MSHMEPSADSGPHVLLKVIPKRRKGSILRHYDVASYVYYRTFATEWEA